MKNFEQKLSVSIILYFLQNNAISLKKKRYFHFIKTKFLYIYIFNFKIISKLYLQSNTKNKIKRSTSSNRSLSLKFTLLSKCLRPKSDCREQAEPYLRSNSRFEATNRRTFYFRQTLAILRGFSHLGSPKSCVFPSRQCPFHLSNFLLVKLNCRKIGFDSV